MKLYTKAGDRGTTSLKYGSTVKKSDDRIEVLGAMDELNSHIGLAKVLADEAMKKKLSELQENLIFLMYGIADPRNRKYRVPESFVFELEQEIDRIEASFSRERKFVLYGGCELSARLDVACTVARRAERRFVKMKFSIGGDVTAMQFMNRVSDYLYILARYVDHLHEEQKCKQEPSPECACGKQSEELEKPLTRKEQITEQEVKNLVTELLRKLEL